jgi:hypothetical protein
MLLALLPTFVWIFLLAVLAAIAIVVLTLVAMLAINRIEIAFESRPKKLARDYFRHHYSHRPIGWVSLTATEPSRWVVGVFFGSTRPPRYKFFAVERGSGAVTEVADCSPYAPKNWR